MNLSRRFVHGAVFAAAGLVLAAFGPGNGKGEELPPFRPGLWEFQRTGGGLTGGKPQVLTNRKCTDPSEDMKKGRRAQEAGGCKFAPVSRTGNRYVFSAECTIRGARIVSRSILTVESDTAYRVEIESRQGDRTTREMLLARRIGDCAK